MPEDRIVELERKIGELNALNLRPGNRALGQELEAMQDRADLGVRLLSGHGRPFGLPAGAVQA